MFLSKNFLNKLSKVTSDKPAYTEKVKTDSGKYVWRYDEKHLSLRAKEKAEKLKKLEKNINKLRAQYKKDMASDDIRIRAIAAIVCLMDETAVRIGNEDSAKEAKTYGATTLLKKHVSVSSGKMTLKFPGKDNVPQHIELKNKQAISIIKELLKDKKDNDFIFEIDGSKIWDRAVNRYLKDFDISAKDIRGYCANDIMKDMLKKYDFEKALDETAEKVGHEPNTLKNQYLDPKLLKKYIKEASLIVNSLDPKSIEDLRRMMRKYYPPTEYQLKQQYNSPEELKLLSIRPGVKTNDLIMNAWRTLSVFLPPQAIMTSGIRDADDQMRVIDELVKKLPEELQSEANTLDYPEKVQLLRQQGFKIADVGTSAHQLGTSFDISGVDLNTVQKIINMIDKSDVPVKFKQILEEPQNNAVHVVIDSAVWDPEQVQILLRQFRNLTTLGTYKIAEPNIYLTSEQKKVFDLLKKVVEEKAPNIKIYAVGGFVRDALLKNKENK